MKHAIRKREGVVLFYSNQILSFMLRQKLEKYLRIPKFTFSEDGNQTC